MPSKSIFLSKTFYGAVLGLLAMFFPDQIAAILSIIGVGDSAMLIDKLLGLIGGGIAIYGRYVAAGGIHIFRATK